MQNIGEVGTLLGRGAVQCTGRTRQARRGCGLNDIVAPLEYLPCGHVRMLGGVVQGQDRRDTGVRPLHQIQPFGTRATAENLLQHCRTARPIGRIELTFDPFGLTILQKEGVELRLYRPRRQPLAVSTGIAAIVMRAAVQEIRLPRVPPQSISLHTVDHRHHVRGAIDDRRIHDLPFA